MPLNQRVSMEKAFSAPHLLPERLGRALDPVGIAELDTNELVNLFGQVLALVRQGAGEVGQSG